MKPGFKPFFINIKKIISLSDFIKDMLKGGDSNIINQKKIEINGLQAEYYQIQTAYNSYMHKAFLEKGGFFYHFSIQIPFEKRLEYQEQLDAFIYSIKLG